MKIRDITLVAVLSALLLGGKQALAFLPNVEIVTLFIILIAICFKFRISISVCLIFTILQMLLYGFNDWVIGYFIVFPALALISFFIGRKTKNELSFAILGGLFGLLFDIPFAIIKGIMFGYNYMIAYLIAGIPFDIIHGVANFIIILLLFKPLYCLIEKHLKKFYYTDEAI